MITLIRFLIALVISLLFSSCSMNLDWGSGVKGNGIVEESVRAANGEFTEVTVAEGLNAIITQGDDYNILVEADENVIDLIRTDLRDGRLKIHSEKNIGNATKNVYITLPNIDHLAASSGGSMRAKSKIISNNLSIDASSGARIELEVEADDMEVDLSSGASISLEGIAEYIDVESSSGSFIDAKELNATTADAEASSGSSIILKVKNQLNAEASSGASIKYLGSPEVSKTKSVSGSISAY